MEYRDLGFLPEAVLNYLVRLGWSHGDQEIFSLDEMIEFFDLSGCNKAASAINPSKLIWLNKHYLKTLDPMSCRPPSELAYRPVGDRSQRRAAFD